MLPEQVYFADQLAYQVICTEALRDPARETGGILVGQWYSVADRLFLVVVAATGPGPNADRQAYWFAPDIEALQAELAVVRQQFARYKVDYIGQWHTHPHGPTQLSAGDTQQAHNILDDPSYVLPDGLFAPLVTLDQMNVQLHGYYYSRDQHEPQPVSWSVIEGEVTVFLEELAQQEREQS